MSIKSVESIFNTYHSTINPSDNEKKSLWVSFSKSDTKEIEPAIFSFQMYKKAGGEASKLVKRSFLLTETKLVYLKSGSEENPKPKAFIPLHFLRVEYDLDSYCDQNGSDSFGEESSYYHTIRLLQHGLYSEIFAKTRLDLKIFLDKISPFTVQTDFHQKFVPMCLLGQGSFARVYKVSRTDTGELFAVKSFSKRTLHAEKRGIQNFVSELEMMKKLDHPSILKLFEVHETENSVYLVMEYLSGKEIFKYRTYKIYDTNKIIFIIRKLLEGLAYLAERNILHRDIKPDNLIFKHDNVPSLQNQVKIVDFGLAVHDDNEDYYHYRCGTPGFIAPEVMNMDSDDPEKYGTKCDVYSAGVVLFCLLTGKNPFDKQGENLCELNKLGEVDFDQFSALKECPKEILELLKQMLKKNPENRISASEALLSPVFEKFGVSEQADEDNGSMDSFEMKTSGIKSNFGNDQFNHFLDSTKDSSDKVSVKSGTIHQRLQKMEMSEEDRQNLYKNWEMDGEKIERWDDISPMAPKMHIGAFNSKKFGTHKNSANIASPFSKIKLTNIIKEDPEIKDDFYLNLGRQDMYDDNEYEDDE